MTKQGYIIGTSPSLEELEQAYVRVGKIQSELGKYPEAIKSFEIAIELQTQLLADPKSNLDLKARNLTTLKELGKAQIENGDRESGSTDSENSFSGFESCAALSDD